MYYVHNDGVTSQEVTSQSSICNYCVIIVACIIHSYFIVVACERLANFSHINAKQRVRVSGRGEGVRTLGKFFRTATSQHLCNKIGGDVYPPPPKASNSSI